MLLIFGLALFVNYTDTDNKKRSFYSFLWISILLIIPRIIGIFTGDSQIAFNEALRAVPLLIIPFACLNIARVDLRVDIEKWFFYGLLISIFGVFIYCEFIIISSIIESNGSFQSFLKVENMDVNFLKAFPDLPKAYVGLLTIFVICGLLFRSYIPASLGYILLVLFGVFLFQIIARNALVVYLLLLITFSFYTKRRYLKVLLWLTFICGIGLVVIYPSEYIKDKFIKVAQKDSALRQEFRLQRLEASYNVFRQAPLFGVGPNNDDTLRAVEYLKLNDDIAARENYNAHNQYIEYLSTYGLLGFICFMMVMAMLIVSAFQKGGLFYGVLLLAFLFACLTESFMERSMGIKYLSIIIGLFFYTLLKNSHGHHLSDGRRT